MRKVILMMPVPVDGFIKGPERDYQDDIRQGESARKPGLRSVPEGSRTPSQDHRGARGAWPHAAVGFSATPGQY